MPNDELKPVPQFALEEFKVLCEDAARWLETAAKKIRALANPAAVNSANAIDHWYQLMIINDQAYAHARTLLLRAWWWARRIEKGVLPNDNA